MANSFPGSLCVVCERPEEGLSIRTGYRLSEGRWLCPDCCDAGILYAAQEALQHKMPATLKMTGKKVLEGEVLLFTDGAISVTPDDDYQKSLCREMAIMLPEQEQERFYNFWSYTLPPRSAGR